MRLITFLLSPVMFVFKIVLETLVRLIVKFAMFVIVVELLYNAVA